MKPDLQTMTEKLVFITGASGFIGSQITLWALKAGYRHRISVRKPEQIAKLKKLYAAYSAKVEFVVVPDFGIQSAFDDVLHGVQFIYHVASPMVGKGESDDLQNGYIDPAVMGTISILEAAAKSPDVQRVVITSSVFAMVPIDVQARGELNDG
jgi:nucleoside-diphosphate-sugar epimerase